MADNEKYLKIASEKQPLKVDKRFYNTIWAEAGGGSPEEIQAVASAFLNMVRREGYERALLGSTAYRKQSPQYVKADTGNFNAFELPFYNRNKLLIDDLLANPNKILPYTHFENVKAFGEPSWAKNMKSFKDIGRQRFYVEQ